MYGFVFYPDGGARPQREYSGGGLHGYRWSLTAGARSIGHSTHTTTARGYSVKADAKEWLCKTLKDNMPVGVEKERAVIAENMTAKVAVVEYFDAVAPLPFGGTNNTAELKATIYGLRLLLSEEGIDEAASLVIRQDSMYVVDGVRKHLPRWIERNFTRPDGTIVTNKDLWLEMHALLNEYKERNVPVNIEWVEAHANCIGNNSADQLATVALFKSREMKLFKEAEGIELKKAPAEGYWDGGSNERHPMMSLRYCFFGVNGDGDREGEYFLSSQGKDVALNGKRTSDDGYCVVRTKPNPILDAIRDRQRSVPHEIDYRFQVDTTNVYGQAYRYLNLYGDQFLHRKHDHVRHLFVGDVLVTEELHPPYLVERVFNNNMVLSDLLDSYRDETAVSLCLTDITDSLYVVEEKSVRVKKGEEPRTEKSCTLRSEIVVGYAKHKTIVNYKVGGEILSAEITLRTGIDFPDRNSLKRLEETMPRVYVLTNWLGGSFMYATVIESGDDCGIWCGMNSSIRIVDPPKKAKAE